MITKEREKEITVSEIDLLKCGCSADYRKWLDRYSGEQDNPFVNTAKEKYELSFYEENKHWARGLKKYLNTFPNGIYKEDAQIALARIESISQDNKDAFRENIEKIGCVMSCVLFGGFFILCMCSGLNFAESLASATIIIPLCYGIIKLTERKKK